MQETGHVIIPSATERYVGEILYTMAISASSSNNTFEKISRLYPRYAYPTESLFCLLATLPGDIAMPSSYQAPKQRCWTLFFPGKPCTVFFACSVRYWLWSCVCGSCCNPAGHRFHRPQNRPLPPGPTYTDLTSSRVEQPLAFPYHSERK